MFEYLPDMKFSEAIEGIHNAMLVLQKGSRLPPKDDALAWRILTEIAAAEQIASPADILEKLDKDKANQYTRQLAHISEQQTERDFPSTPEVEAAAERFLKEASSSRL